MTLGGWISMSVGALTLTMASAVAQPATPVSNANQCFTANQFENWRAADARTIYIRVRGNHYYRLDLGGECSELLAPEPRLLTTFRGSNLICSALDWDLKVSAGLNGTVEPCIVKMMTMLSPAEVAALPKKTKP